MSLRRVRQRLARMLAEHEDGERDGHAPTAQAHARLAAQLREDIAAIDAAEAYTRRVRAEALREAADRLSAHPVTAGLLREWADEIEGGR